MNYKLLELLRLWNDGKREVLTCYKKNNDYIYCLPVNDATLNALQHAFESIETLKIIDRIQFELYGEFPLSIDNKFDFENNIASLFKISFP